MYLQETTKSFDQATIDLEQAILESPYLLLNVTDLAESLRAAGIEQLAPCRIFELCHPRKTHEALNLDVRLAMALPCRISVYVEKGTTFIGMISPATVMSGASRRLSLYDIARVLDKDLRSIIDAAV